MHITMGTRDDNHLHNAVRLMEDLLKNTNNPYYAVDVEYGPHQPHCFTGDAREDLLVGARFAQSGGMDGKVCSSRRGYEELGILNDTPVLPG